LPLRIPNETNLMNDEAKKPHIQQVEKPDERTQDNDRNDHHHRLAEQFLAGRPRTFHQFHLHLFDESPQISDNLAQFVHCAFRFSNLAGEKGVEPLTPGFGDQCSAN
jgi:hypothetical protein